jgi:NAD dependent epimerase/dehydratase family enzyme
MSPPGQRMDFLNHALDALLRRPVAQISLAGFRRIHPSERVAQKIDCLGLGAVIGTGNQPLPWIHIDDMIGILLHVIDQPDTRDRYNAVSPGIVTNRQFVEAFGRRLRRPVLWSVPEWLICFVVGDERSSILLQGQLVRPKRTLGSGYIFRYPELASALDDLVYVTL